MDALSNATKIEEYLVYRATQNKRPLGGSLELLPLCNMNCDMCYVRLSREEMERKGKLRSVQEWIALAEDMKKEGVLFLMLTGGEPLLYEGFKELYLKLLQLGMIVTINTNGTLIDEEWARFFGENKPRRINVTLYGKDDVTYEKVCHYKAGFDRVMNGLRLLKEHHVDVKLNGSLTKENVNDIQRILELADELELPINIDTYMYPADRERDLGFQEASRVSPEMAAEIKRQIIKHSMKEQYGEYCHYVGKMVEAAACSEAENIVQCRAGRSSFVVTWQGDMRPCVMMEGISINVFERGFKESWETIVDKVQQIRTSRKCSTCSYRENCQNCAACAMLETGSYDGTPEYLCHYTETLVKGLLDGRE